jgi:protease-4
MLRFLRLFFAIMLSQVLLGFLALFLGIAVVASFQGAPVVESESLLWVPLQGEIIEYPTLPTIPFVRRKPLSQAAILESLEHATRDDRVSAVLIDIDHPWIGWGKAAELHEAILRFRNGGKQVLAVAPELDEMGLYVASACDSIFLSPAGRLYLNGIGVGPMYYKGAFDKLDINPNFSRIGEFKDAVEPNIRTDMSDESREQFGWLMDGLWSVFLETVQSRRNVGRGEFEEALSNGVLLADEAVEFGFVDAVRYREAIVTRFVDDLNDPKFILVLDYHEDVVSSRSTSGKAIAVVHTRGLILRGGNDYAPGVGTILGARSVVRDLEAAAADDDIAAVVLRVDSPGGEIIASDIISNAVERVRARKPLVASMVDVAASGGYMMLFRANSIVALPTTLTGSIGSYIGKLNLRGLYHKLGLTRDFVTRGSYPFLFSDYHDWSAPERELIARQQQLDYERWISSVAAYRGLTPERVDSLGRGRVWTGQQALEHGLIDELGDQSDAIRLAQDLAGMPEDARPRLVHYPKPRSILDVFLAGGDGMFAGVVEGWVRSWRLPAGTSTWGVLDVRFLP